MRIVNSQTTMASDHTAVAISRRHESLRVWGDRPSNLEDPGRFRENLPEASDEVSISLSAMNLQIDIQKTTLQTDISARHGKSKIDKGEAADKCDDRAWKTGDAKLEVMRMIVEHLSGKKVKIYSPETDNEDKPSDDKAAKGEKQVKAEDAQEAPERVGWGVEYDLHEVEIEAERTSFSSTGIVKTSDGKEIAFDVSLEMSREHVEIRNFSLRAGDAKVTDPLVINFSGTAAQLTESKTDFDLDADGKSESISFVRAGSGFLVLDRNRDGIVNDGSELFGPKTGDGFDELEAFDEDGNGWIDEGDSVYSDLRVWTRDSGGKDNLSTLAEKNVGAIHLDRASTPFELKNTANETDGIIRSTGVYLSEEGEVGTVQQVDLVT
ncbi:MAG: VCBS repeat-containing protein [Proteobacteria bacterium]|nr:VCBS repeat-containing protein [Pseudomonadota bacterium]